MFVALAGSLTRQHASKAAGFAAVAIVAAASIGWWAGLPLLSSWGWGWGLGFAHTKPVTALCLAALGLALVHPARTRPLRSRLAWWWPLLLPPIFSISPSTPALPPGLPRLHFSP